MLILTWSLIITSVSWSSTQNGAGPGVRAHRLLWWPGFFLSRGCSERCGRQSFTWGPPRPGSAGSAKVGTSRSGQGSRSPGQVGADSHGAPRTAQADNPGQTQWASSGTWRPTIPWDFMPRGDQRDRKPLTALTSCFEEVHPGIGSPVSRAFALDANPRTTGHSQVALSPLMGPLCPCLPLFYGPQLSFPSGRLPRLSASS